jgi:hypothetical protein
MNKVNKLVLVDPHLNDGLHVSIRSARLADTLSRLT